MSKNVCECNGCRHVFEARYEDTEIIDKETMKRAIEFYNENSAAPMMDYKIKNHIYLFDYLPMDIVYKSRQTGMGGDYPHL